jgi:hypothetical protein
MTEEQVTGLPGPPLAVRPLMIDGERSWIYSRTAADSSYRVRAIFFKERAVVKKVHELYVD